MIIAFDDLISKKLDHSRSVKKIELANKIHYWELHKFVPIVSSSYCQSCLSIFAIMFRCLVRQTSSLSLLCRHVMWNMCWFVEIKKKDFSRRFNRLSASRYCRTYSSDTLSDFCANAIESMRLTLEMIDISLLYKYLHVKTYFFLRIILISILIL